MLLRVHSSNFKQIGFTAEVVAGRDGRAWRTRPGVLVVDDLGSGTLLDTSRYGMAREPMVQESVAAGADLVTFSGDKLLGGPQAGLIVGRAELVQRLRRHPLTRALRVDKATLAALQATLLHYVRGEAEREIPVWQMISRPTRQLGCPCGRPGRAAAGATGSRARVVPVSGHGRRRLTARGDAAQRRGGRIPAAGPPDELARRLRSGQPPVVGRIAEDELLLDLRTVQPDEDELLRGPLLHGVRRSRSLSNRGSRQVDA